MAPRSGKRVAFRGAACVEFDAEQPPVVRLCGCAPSSPRASGDGEAAAARLRLECQARGLQDERALQDAYRAELAQALRARGFAPLGDALDELRTQLRVVDVLLALAALADAGGEEDASTALPAVDWTPAGVASEQLLQRVQLAMKDLDGRVDESYAFGRRFVTVETFVDALERPELVEMALARGLELPKIDEKEKDEIKVPDRELIALRGSGAGKTLKQLTLRELVEEANAHGVDVEHERDGGAKKSKRAWIDILRPLVHEDIVRIRVLMREEELLRELLTVVIEREAIENQRQRIQAVMRQCVQQYKLAQDSQPDMEPDASTLKTANPLHFPIDEYFAKLALAMEASPEQVG